MKPKDKPKMTATPAPLPEQQVSDFKKTEGKSRKWSTCKECKEQVWTEYTGEQFYHRLSCKKSNGVRYGKDRG